MRRAHLFLPPSFDRIFRGLDEGAPDLGNASYSKYDKNIYAMMFSVFAWERTMRNHTSPGRELGEPIGYAERGDPA